MAIQETELPNDQEIQLKLRERTTDELLAFQQKLKAMTDPTPQSWAVRLHLIRELLSRQLESDWGV